MLSGWTKSILALGVWQRILDVIAYGLEKLMYVVDYDIKNSFLQTARDLFAVVAHAWALRYKVHRQYGGTGRVKISGDPTFSAALVSYVGPSVPIARWTTMSDTQGQVNVYATEDIIYPQGMVIGNRTLPALGVPSNLGGGKIGFTVNSHGFPIGQEVFIRGTQYYDGDYLVDPLTSINQIVIDFPNAYQLETFNGSEKIFTGVMYLPVKEGQPASFTYIANGDVNEKFVVYTPNADNDEVEVFIVDSNNVVLFNVTITDDIYLVNSLAQYYCSIESLPSFQGFTVQFGDDVTSKKLNNGDRVLVRYANTKGAEGSVDSVGIVSRFTTTVLDTAGNSANVFVTNDDIISGGAGVEDIEHARHFSRNKFYAGQRFHSGEDDVIMLDAHPAIVKSKVWSDADVNINTISGTNSIVHISAVSTSGGPLSLAQQSDIKINYLKKKRAVTDILKFEPLNVVCVQFRIFASLLPVAAPPIITSIYNGLNAKYGILNAPYKQSIFSSQAISEISKSDPVNILHHSTDIWHVDRSEDFPVIAGTLSNYPVVVTNPAGIEPDPEKQIYLQDGKVEVWITRKIAGETQPPLRIAYTDPLITNQLIGDNGYTILSGIVDYLNGQITYIVNDIITDTPPDATPTFGVLNPDATDNDGYAIRITYKTEDGNGKFLNDIRLPHFYNITNVHLEDVSPPFFTFDYEQVETN